MDPLSIASASGSIALVCIRLSKALYTWINQTKGIDEEIQGFAAEVVAYSRVLSAIDQNLRRPAIADTVRNSVGDFWSHVKRSLDDCSETLALLEKVLDNLGGASKNSFAKVAKNVKLGAAFEKITTLRRQINTYNSTMQLALQMCLVSQNLSNESFHENLNAKINLILQETRDIRDHLEMRPVVADSPLDDSAISLRSQLSENADNAVVDEEGLDPAFETKVYDHITEILENAKSLASVAVQSDSLSFSGSVVSISDETYTAIENWIWAEDGPSMSVWAKIELKMPSKSRRLGVYDSRKGYGIDNLCFLCNEIDALCEQEITRSAAASLLMSFFKRWERFKEKDGRQDMVQDIVEEIKQQRCGGGILAGSQRHGEEGILAESQDKPSLLHLVASINQVEFLGILIQRGADVEVGAGACGTPLHFAARFGHVQAVLFLLDQGANADALNSIGMTPLMEACEAGQETTAQILLNRTTDVMLQAKDTLRTALHLAIDKRLHDTSKLIISAALNVDIPDAKGETPLIMACTYPWSCKSEVEFLLDKGAETNIFRKDGESAFSLACKIGHTELVQQLFQRGASLQNPQQPFDQSPMFYACKYGQVEILQLLLQYGATINTSKHPFENSLFTAVVQSNNVDAIKLVIDSDPVHFLFAKTPKDESSLHIACQMGLSTVTVQWLVDATSDVDCVDKHGKSPLHHAVIGGHVDIIRLLFENGAGAYHKDDQGRSVCGTAVEEKRNDVIAVILEGIGGSFSLHYASGSNDDRLVGELLALLKSSNSSTMSVNDLNSSGKSPLHFATLNKRFENMNLLLRNGAEVNVKTTTGDTPLHCAAQIHSEEAIDLLLKWGGDRSIANYEGKQPRDVVPHNKRIARLDPPAGWRLARVTRKIRSGVGKGS